MKEDLYSHEIILLIIILILSFAIKFSNLANGFAEILIFYSVIVFFSPTAILLGYQMVYSFFPAPKHEDVPEDRYLSKGDFHGSVAVIATAFLLERIYQIYQIGEIVMLLLIPAVFLISYYISKRNPVSPF